jgi:AraC family transcriptional regulator of adaptative response/methylated-DNA-[protein]-cysteine methyltransferase
MTTGATVPLFIQEIDTPLGAVIAAATPTHLVLLEFAERPMVAAQLARLEDRLGCAQTPGESLVLALLRVQLGEYFAGERREFDVPLRAPGTEFQESVWLALQTIPCGVTRSYSDVAKAIGRPTAVRAVAAANGDNRIAILIPCHRVIGANGTLTGYGGGLWRKRRLLDLEAGVEGLL